MKTGADLFVEYLVKNKVEYVFAISGAGNLKLLDSISKNRNIKLIFHHHEQAAVMAAQGYFRISRKPGVVLVTTGGGTSNTLTGVLSAFMDSDKVFLVSGNETSYNISRMNTLRALGVQGFESTSVLRPVTKSSIRITSTSEISNVFEKSWAQMSTGRYGPVHIDFPMDLQNAPLVNQNSSTNRPSTDELRTDNSLLNSRELILLEFQKSHKPLLYLGNGLRDAESLPLFIKEIQRIGIPYVVSWSAIDLFDSSDPFNSDRAGIYGNRATNILIQQADLLLCIGTRLAIPQIGYDQNDFARNATKWIVDIDENELNKFSQSGWNLIQSDSEEFIKQFLELSKNLKDQNYTEWFERVKKIHSDFPKFSQIEEVSKLEENTYFHSIKFLELLNLLLPNKSTVVTDVGAALLSTHFIFKNNKNFRLTTSQGLGEMGFGLPASIGAYLADSSQKIICIENDGSIMMNLQELQTIKYNKIPIKIFIMNNYGYSSIRISQSNLYESNFVGIDKTSGLSFPNFKNIAKSFNLKYLRITPKTLFLEKRLKKILTDNQSWVIDVSISPNQKFLPRLSTQKDANGKFISPPLEDLDPQISINQLETGLGYQPKNASYQIRNLTKEY